jgi:hypothetical protein
MLNLYSGVFQRHLLFIPHVLTFDIQSAHICTLNGTFIMAKVHTFRHLNTTNRSACSILNNYFLNRVKFNLHTFFHCYLLDVCTGFSPTSSNWISPLCGIPWSTRECIGQHCISCTVFRCHCMMGWKYNISIHNECAQNCTLYSATVQVFGCIHTKGNIHFQLQLKGLTVMYETKNFVFGLRRLLSLHNPISQ